MKFIGVMKDAWDWCVKNGNQIKKLAVSLGAALLVFRAFEVVPVLLLAIENAFVAAAMGGSIFGSVMTAALGPVGLLSAAVGGLVYLYQSVGEAKELSEKEKKTDYEQGDISITKQNDENFAYFEKKMNKKQAAAAAMAATIEDLNYKINANEKALYPLIKDNDNNSNPSKEYTDLIKESNILNHQLETAKKYTGPKADLIPKTLKSPLSTTAAAGKVKDTSKTKAVGQKSVTINVSIKDLIGVQNINTTNLKEGAGKIKDLVVAALTGAVNDFQIVAGH
jgi:hypothetical protein